MFTATKWLRHLHYPSEVGGEADLIRTWGFPIYRTAYGPSTDQKWEQLLKTIRTHAYDNTLRITEATEDDPIFQQIWSFFRLDARSNAALSGLTFEQLRLLYIKSDGGVPVNSNLPSHRVFLVVDEEVLSGVEGCIVKCVEADYLAEEHVSRNPRCPQRYWGFMKMRADAVVQLWKELQLFKFRPLRRRRLEGVIWWFGKINVGKSLLAKWYWCRKDMWKSVYINWNEKGDIQHVLETGMMAGSFYII
ncbi:hypothetical protein IQ06DRAFT_351812 [Phaeosphaeriaceae sp. SRC1lsM3a]|nr:hypothetical protein IQ06DRAFT_351812 [Stagonospora sp. SRC1lsM3a]